MGTEKRQLITCRACTGDKTYAVYDENGDCVGLENCLSCGGTGKMHMGWLELCSENVFESYEVLDCIDPTEHDALTDTQKDGVLHLLACGKVDLNDGKAGRVRLWNWFGAESTTVANLTALLAG